MPGALALRIARLLALGDTSFARGFPQMVSAVEAGMRREEAALEMRRDRLLRECRAEHAMLLCALHRVAVRVEGGDLEAGRQAAAALLAMLPLRRGIPAPEGIALQRLLRWRCGAVRDRRRR